MIARVDIPEPDLHTVDENVRMHRTRSTFARTVLSEEAVTKLPAGKPLLSPGISKSQMQPAWKSEERYFPICSRHVHRIISWTHHPYLCRILNVPDEEGMVTVEDCQKVRAFHHSNCDGIWIAGRWRCFGRVAATAEHECKFLAVVCLATIGITLL